jgi:ubiquinone/menaquinone biosynthesis C-methylase UbiE
MKLDLGCGANKIAPDFMGVDQLPAPGVDIIWDLEQFPYPFEDNSVDEIYCSEYIEHASDLIMFMEELYRIMKPNTTGIITGPYWSHVNTWRDPTHKRGMADWTLYFFNKEWRENNGKDCYKINANFDVGYTVTFDPVFLSKFEDKTIEEKNFAIMHYNNVISGIIYAIRKL